MATILPQSLHVDCLFLMIVLQESFLNLLWATYVKFDLKRSKLAITFKRNLIFSLSFIIVFPVYHKNSVFFI